MNCVSCEKETTNPKFCSKSCSARWTNKVYPKRKTKIKCFICGEAAKSYRHNRCATHWEEYKAGQYKTKTIGDYRDMLSVKGKHPSWIHAHVRTFARRWLKDLASEPCRFCGYSKHVELAHIRAVTTFPDTALLSEVNSRENVLPLCRNCHWEYDNLPR